jgi:hypothetical protein
MLHIGQVILASSFIVIVSGNESSYFLRCDSALAAADLAAGEEFGSLITFEARDATAALVTSNCVRNCISVLAAADRCAGVDSGLLRTLDAIEATRLLVSLEDMLTPALDGLLNRKISKHEFRHVTTNCRQRRYVIGSITD